MLVRVFSLIAATLTLGLLVSAQPSRGMTAVDFIEIPRLSDPRLAPDGRAFAYLQTETDWTENKINKRLHVIDLVTGQRLATPTFRAQESAIWWHPKQAGYVYLDKPSDGAKTQAFYFDLETGESAQLTRFGEAVQDLIWHPDGTGFFFVAAEQQPASDRTLLDAGWLIPPYGANADREVWWYDMDSGEMRPEIQGVFSVTDASISRSGDFLIVGLAPDQDLDTRHLSDVFVRNLDTLETTRWTLNRFREAAPHLSPDATRIAYIASVNQDGDAYYESKVFVESLNGRRQRLLGKMAMEALALAWDQSGEGLFILGNTGVRSNLYHYSLQTETLRQITRGDHTIEDWTYNPAKDTHVARFETMSDPGDYQIMRDRSEGFVPLTSLYSDWPDRFKRPRQSVFKWRGRRGAELEGLLVLPLDHDPSVAYPLVTITHGGPRSSSRFGSWQVSRYLPVLAAQGYIVFLPNHRGGTGYGDRFVRDMVGSYFRNAHHDVIDGIDALIDRGLADPDRLVKMGWSAGGHMVNKLITHTDRFAAASSGAGASDWLSMHGESDVRHARETVFGGAPWERAAPRRRYRLDSPIKDAWKVKTPTLFFAGENDLRVPPTQSILMHRGVQAAGTPTVYYQAADEPHNFRKPANQLFKINTELAWFARFALGETYRPALPDAAYSDASSAPENTPDNASAQAASSP